MADTDNEHTDTREDRRNDAAKQYQCRADIVESKNTHIGAFLYGRCCSETREGCKEKTEECRSEHQIDEDVNMEFDRRDGHMEYTFVGEHEEQHTCKCTDESENEKG